MDSVCFLSGNKKGGTFLKVGEISVPVSFEVNGKMETKNIPVSGSYSSSMSISGNIGTGSNTTEHTWMDINGDGLPDKVMSNGNVQLNLGYAFAAEESWGQSVIRKGTNTNKGAGLGFSLWKNSVSGGLSLAGSDHETTSSLQDINGDGLPGMVTSSLVRLNTGSGFGSSVPWAGLVSVTEGNGLSEGISASFTYNILIPPPAPPAILVGLKLSISVTGNAGIGMNAERSRISDINGDGYPDYLSSKKDNHLKVKLSTIGRTNKLKKVSQPLGSHFTVDYERLGNTYDLPQSKWVLKEVVSYDGFQGDGVDTTKNTFRYENGYHDRRERAFYGFETVTTNQHDMGNGGAVYRTQIQEFENGSYHKKGLLLSEYLQDKDGNKYTETVNTYGLTDRSDLASDVKFPTLTKTEKRFFEGEATAKKSTATEVSSYDTYGNITKYIDRGDNGTGDDYQTTIEYHKLTTPYIVGVPKKMQVKSLNGTLFRERSTEIDANTGRMTAISSKVSGTEEATVNAEYDSYGNLKKIISPPNHNGERMFFEYEYDNETHTYPTNVKDAFGYSSQSVYDYRFGIPLSMTSMNGQVTNYTIDDAGRISTIQAPNEVADGVAFTIRYKYFPNATIPWAQTEHYDPQHPTNFIETATFSDAFGRILQTKKDMAIFDPQTKTETEQMMVSGNIVYDGLGRAEKLYFPVAEQKGTTSTMNTGADTQLMTETEYEVMNRPLKVTFPDNTEMTNEYGFANDRAGNLQFYSLTTDQKGIQSETYTNLRGLQTASRRNKELWVSQTYNAINELMTVNDHKNNVTTYTYDLLGRTISVNHPDRGLREMTYDLASNQTSMMTANLKADQKPPIQYTYEYNRPKQIIYPTFELDSVLYEYGEPGAAENRAGRVVTIHDRTGTHEFSYGRLGEIVKNRRVIDINQTDPVVPMVFETNWEYDSWNRPQTMTYPDGEVVKYSYNLGGKITKIEGEKGAHSYEYVRQVGYNEFEEQIYIALGNGTKTEYQYEEDFRRLQTMQTHTPTRTIMDNVYSYDKVGNILSIENNALKPANGQKGGASLYSYTYDNHYRLTGATGEV